MGNLLFFGVFACAAYAAFLAACGVYFERFFKRK
jgi:hypothetical protein